MNTTSGSEADDPLQEARAYNQSIYLMVAAPYCMLGAISLLVYRGYRSAAKKSQPPKNVQEGANEPDLGLSS
jgi:hypothetical protein